MPETTIQDAIRTEQAIAERHSRNKKIALGIPSERTETTESAFAALGEAPAPGIGKAIVSHKTDKTIIMYAAPYGTRRPVPEGSVRACLAEGLYLDCPVCQRDHEGADVCPKLPQVPYTRCPVCGKRFEDDRAVPEAIAVSDDPNFIPTELPGSPKARITAKVHAHMIIYHEEAARRAGLLKAEEAVPKR